MASAQTVTLSLAGAAPGMYPVGSYISISGQLMQVISTSGSVAGTTITVATPPDYPPEGIGPQKGQGTSKACISCQLSLVCGYRQDKIPFYFCPVCQRVYVPLVTDAHASPMKVKQILIKKECPVKAVLDLKQPCHRCANREKLRARGKKIRKDLRMARAKQAKRKNHIRRRR